MEEIETFVRKMCAEGDLSILTKKLIRTQYQAHYNKTTVTREEKDKINQVLDAVVQELADQSRDLPVSTDAGEFVNTSPLDQGKENLRTDYVSLSSTTSPTAGIRPKAVHKSSRTELGVTNLGHNRLIQVSLNRNTLSHTSKNSGVRVRSSSAGNNEVPQQHYSSPRRRSSSDSVSSNHARELELTHKASDSISDDHVSDFKVTECDREGMGRFTSLDAGDSKSTISNCKNRQVLDHRSADCGTDFSSDEVILLSPGSDGSAPSKKLEINSPKGKKILRDKGKTADKSGMSGSGVRICSKVSTRQQYQKAKRMYSVQSVLSAILESDESEIIDDQLNNLSEEEEEVSSSPLDKSSRLSLSPGGLQRVKKCHGSKAKDNQRRQRRNHQEESTERSIQKSDSDHCNGQSHSAGQVDIDSDDSQDKPLVIDEGFHHQPTLHERLQDDSSSAPRAGPSSNIQHSGFTHSSFFGKKVEQVTKHKVKKPKRPRIESDSDLSCDSMPSPRSKMKSTGSVFHKATMLQSDADSDLDDTLLSEVKEQLTEESSRKVVANTRILKALKSSSDDDRTSASSRKMTISNTSSSKHTLATRVKSRKNIRSAKLNSEKKTGQSLQRNKVMEQEQSLSDDSTDDLPLIVLQQKGKKLIVDEDVICMSESEANRGTSKPQENGRKKYQVRTLKNKVRKGSTGSSNKVSSTDSDIIQSPVPFSPPVSPVVKKAVKQIQMTYSRLRTYNSKSPVKYKTAVPKITEYVLPDEQPVTVFSLSENTEGDSSCYEVSGRQKELLGPSISRSITTGLHEKSVYSLSDTTEDEPAIQKRTSLTNKRKLNQGTKSSVNILPHENSMYSLSENTEEDAASQQSQPPSNLKKKLILKKRYSAVNNVSKDGTSKDKQGYSVMNNVSKDGISKEHLASSERTAFVIKQATTKEKVACAVEAQTREVCDEIDTDSDEPWYAVAYDGGPLMFPVIFLEDIQQRKRVPPANSALEMVSSKRERNIFEVLECSNRKEEKFNDVTTSCSKSTKVFTSISEVNKEQSHSFVSSIISTPVSKGETEKTQPVSLDESRTVLKKQRTVKKITPKLRTTLKLRKQVSPDKKAKDSSEVEEWTVVSQEEPELNGGNRKRLRKAVCDVYNPRQKRCSKARKRKAMSAASLSEKDDDQPLKERLVSKSGDDLSDSGKDDFDSESNTPVKTKGRKRKVMSAASLSEEDNNQPLKERLISKSGDDLSDSDKDDFDSEGNTPVKTKRPKKKRRVQLDSSDEDDLPLKPTSIPIEADVGKDSESEGIEIKSVSDTDAGVDSSLKVKRSKKQKKKQHLDSSDENDVPLKPKSATVNSEKEKSHSSSDVNSISQSDDATPVKLKASLKAPKLVIMSSEDGMSPMKVKLKEPSQDSESDLDTSSLSSENENDTVLELEKPQGPRIKFTMKKVQPAEKLRSENTEAKVTKKVRPSHTEKEEAPYLKRLRQICRKVGIFVRNDSHFAGCSSDKQKIERLKEALRKAGMKGQPSLSKVDSVNLRREAEALDTANIIETSGRPKRQPKNMYGSVSPKKSLSPIKQQFSRIKDLISESESD